MSLSTEILQTSSAFSNNQTVRREKSASQMSNFLSSKLSTKAIIKHENMQNTASASNNSHSLAMEVRGKKIIENSTSVGTLKNEEVSRSFF